MKFNDVPSLLSTPIILLACVLKMIELSILGFAYVTPRIRSSFNTEVGFDAFGMKSSVFVTNCFRVKEGMQQH